MNKKIYQNSLKWNKKTATIATEEVPEEDQALQKNELLKRMKTKEIDI